MGIPSEIVGIIQTEQAAGLKEAASAQRLVRGALANNFAHSMDMLNKMAATRWDEVDPRQASALDRLEKSRMPTDIQFSGLVPVTTRGTQTAAPQQPQQ